MKDDQATRDSERLPQPEETISQSVRRVVGYWQTHQRDCVFVDCPRQLAEEYPDIFGCMNQEDLGILCSLVWIFLGEGVNQSKLLRWFDGLISKRP